MLKRRLGNINVVQSSSAKRHRALRSFQYDAALCPDQIRLLRIEAGTENTPIRIGLQTRSRRLARYHALSYTWGAPDFTHRIECNRKELMVTASLHDLLLTLRRDYASQWLWIDAICINQSDPKDKSIQVRRMSTIYRQADTVIVWLGRDDASTEDGLRLLEKICQVFPSSNGQDIRSLFLDPNTLPMPHELEKDGTFAEMGIPSDITASEWKAASAILDAPWFGRRWILQEITSSRRCIFKIGKHETTPEIILGGIYRFANFREFQHTLNRQQRETCSRVVTIVQLLRAQQSQWLHESLADALIETTAFQSSDPRDRVFAIVGCLQSFPDHLVSYEKTLADVLVDVALCETDEEESKLSLLRGLCYVDKLHQDLPSWVPTWEFYITRSMWDTSEQDCTDVEQMEMSVSRDRRTLLTKGIIFDTIVELSDPTFNQDGLPFADDDALTQRQGVVQGFNEKCEWLVQCQSIAERACVVTTKSERCLEDFISCYNLGESLDWGDEFNGVETYQTYLRHSAIMNARLEYEEETLIAQAYRDRCRMLRVPPQPPGKSTTDSTIANTYEKEFVEVADSWLVAEDSGRFGRRFIRTDAGKIGWAPQGAMLGDELCVLFGFATPFAIRKTQTHHHKVNEYHLVGACYVHEHMDGEIFLNDELQRVMLEIV